MLEEQKSEKDLNCNEVKENVGERDKKQLNVLRAKEKTFENEEGTFHLTKELAQAEKFRIMNNRSMKPQMYSQKDVNRIYNKDKSLPKISTERFSSRKQLTHNSI